MPLVLGASGYTGLAVTRALVARGMGVRGLVRRGAAADTVRAAGASDVVVADLRDLDAVDAAARGADGIFFIGPRFMPEEAALGKAVVDLAQRAGVRRFVLSGVYHSTIRALVNHRTKREIEDHLYKSDLEFTVLQPARYRHGLLLWSWGRLVDDGVLADAFATDATMAHVDYADVPEVAAIAFGEDRPVGGTFELSSHGQHTLDQIAAALSPVFGRPIRAERVPLSEYEPARPLLSTRYSADGFRALRRHYDAHGFHGGNALAPRTILGRDPAGFSQCAAALLQRTTQRDR